MNSEGLGRKECSWLTKSPDGRVSRGMALNHDIHHRRASVLWASSRRIPWKGLDTLYALRERFAWPRPLPVHFVIGTEHQSCDFCTAGGQDLVDSTTNGSYALRRGPFVTFCVRGPFEMASFSGLELYPGIQWSPVLVLWGVLCSLSLHLARKSSRSTIRVS